MRRFPGGNSEYLMSRRNFHSTELLVVIQDWRSWDDNTIQSVEYLWIMVSATEYFKLTFSCFLNDKKDNIQLHNFVFHYQDCFHKNMEHECPIQIQSLLFFERNNSNFYNSDISRSQGDLPDVNYQSLSSTTEWSLNWSQERILDIIY